MIIGEIFALLIGEIAEDLQRAEVVGKVAGCDDWIEDVDGSVDGKHCRHFGDDRVDFALDLAGEKSEKVREESSVYSLPCQPCSCR
jgi:hypothetical protein